jgi:CYTH domain-containing protein
VALPKYARCEIERRWLVEPRAVESLELGPPREIEDVYLPGTGLRLRKLSESGTPPVFKLCKKYGKSTGRSEAITNLYLTEAEYTLLRSALDGQRVRKVRHAVAGGSLDLYPGEPSLAVFEIEFDSEDAAATYVPPDFVGAEVTTHPAYSGAALAGRGS